MKKIIIGILAILSFVLFTPNCNAASGTIKVTSSSSTVIVGNTVTVTVTLSSSSALGAWEFNVNYDSKYLQLTSSTAENNGTYFVSYGNGSTKTKTYTLKFKALKSGSTSITVGSYDVYAYDTSSMSITTSNKKLTLMTQSELEATYSKDNYLKSLSVMVGEEEYELDSTFDKEVTNYSVTVPTGTTSVEVVASVNDSKSSISGSGDIEVSEGINVVSIVVTAQNGDEKTYTLTINVEDQNPIEVVIDNNTYTVVKSASLLTGPATFEETTININGYDIPAFINNLTNITLIGLKDINGNINLYIYEDGTYSIYNEISLKSYLLIPLSFEEDLDLIKTSITINDEEVEAYKYSENSNFVIIYAQNLEDGSKDLYLYDTVNKTAQLYDLDYYNDINETINNYSYIIIAFFGAIILMLIVIFVLLHSLKKKQKKINKFVEKQEAKIEATRKLNDVIEEVEKITNEEKAKKEEDNLQDEEVKPVQEPKLSKKELKKLKKQEKNKKQEENKEENDNKKDDDIVEVKEIQVGKDSDLISENLEEEMYDLFEDDKKKKKKKH